MSDAGIRSGREGEEEVVPEDTGRITVEIRHACTYIPEDDQWVPAPGENIPEVVSPPVVVDTPYVGGTGEVGGTLNCTMGNWQGEPTEYQYRWFSDGAPNAGIAADYVVVAGDAGKLVTCVVTATNAGGSAAAPPSNGVSIAAPAPEGEAVSEGASARQPPVNQARLRREAVQASAALNPPVEDPV